MCGLYFDEIILKVSSSSKLRARCRILLTNAYIAMNGTNIKKILKKFV